MKRSIFDITLQDVLDALPNPCGYRKAFEGDLRDIVWSRAACFEDIFAWFTLDYKSYEFLAAFTDFPIGVMRGDLRKPRGCYLDAVYYMPLTTYGCKYEDIKVYDHLTRSGAVWFCGERGFFDPTVESMRRELFGNSPTDQDGPVSKSVMDQDGPVSKSETDQDGPVSKSVMDQDGPVLGPVDLEVLEFLISLGLDTDQETVDDYYECMGDFPDPWL